MRKYESGSHYNPEDRPPADDAELAAYYAEQEAVGQEAFDAKTREVIDEADRINRRTRRIVIGIASAATALAVGAAGVFTIGGNEVKATHRPAASAPAVPGPQETNISTPEQAGGALGPEQLTEEAVPLYIDIDGNGELEKYEGVQALAKALEIKVADYPDPEDAAKVLIERLDKMATMGANEKSVNLYKNYATDDGLLEGVTAVGSDFVQPAFEAAFTKFDRNDMSFTDQTTNEWANDLGVFLTDTLSNYSHSVSELGNGTPYSVRINFKGAEFSLASTNENGVGGSVTFSVRDNLNDTSLPSLGIGDEKNLDGTWHLNLKKVDNGDGELKWVVSGSDGTLEKAALS